jgi:hypothetical protein
MNGSKKKALRNLRRYLLGTSESNAQKIFFFGKRLMLYTIRVQVIYKSRITVTPRSVYMRSVAGKSMKNKGDRHGDTALLPHRDT